MAYNNLMEKIGGLLEVKVVESTYNRQEKLNGL